MADISITRAREEFATLFNRVAFGGDRIIIGRRGKDQVALVPMEDLRRLQTKEDEADIEVADAALARSDQRIPYEDIRRELGL